MNSNRKWISFSRKRDKHDTVSFEEKSYEPQIYDPLLRKRSNKKQNLLIAAFLVFLLVLISIIYTSVGFVTVSTNLKSLAEESCRITLDMTMPENMTFPKGTPEHVSLYDTWSSLISSAEKSIDIAAYFVTLRSIDVAPFPYYPSSRIGEKILEDLMKAGKERGVKIRILISKRRNNSSSLLDFTILTKKVNVEMRALDPEKFFGSGIQHAKMMIVDKKHFFIGSANLDWRALAQNKELGITLYNCSTLAYDMEKVFETYWNLAVLPPELPLEWPQNLQTSINIENPLPVRINGSLVSAYIAGTPPSFCPTGRTTDLQAILDIIGTARKFIYASILSYLSESTYMTPKHYWPILDDALRKAIAIRGLQVRVMAFNHSTNLQSRWFLNSLQALRSYKFDIDVRLYSVPFYSEALSNLRHARRKHERYIVTDNTAYIGNSDWTEDFFTTSTGVSIIFRDAIVNGTTIRNLVREDLVQLFNADWNSQYAYPV